MTQAEPFPTRLAVPLDTYRALVQMQIDYYATQGNAGPDWAKRAKEDIACAFCVAKPVEPTTSPWLEGVRIDMAEADALQRETQADKDDEAMGDWTR